MQPEPIPPGIQKENSFPYEPADVPERPKLLFLNRSYWPDIEATGQLLTELCENLSSDFDVSVVAGKPNQLSNPETDGGWDRVRHHRHVTIHRIDHCQFSKRHIVTKSLNYLSFVRATRRKLRKVPAPDIVIFETDPFLLPFEAARLQRRTGCHMVGYLQDIYPDVAVALGKVPNNWMIRRLRESMFSIYRQCDRMIVLSEDMKRLLVEGRIHEDRIHVVPNWADTSQIAPIPKDNLFRQRHQIGSRFLVMYSGNLGLTQRLEEFLEAAQLLKDMPEILFAFVGQGSQKSRLESLVQSRSLTNVQFFDYQPKSELAHSLSAADLHLVPLTKELSQCLMPSKLYGILASGRPYLTNAVPESELHQLTVKYQVGLTVPPGNPAEIANAVRAASQNRQSLQTMGANARSLAESQFSQACSMKQFRNVIQQVLKEG
ncbi:MAG: glycosyltransferase family 4 protein [Planctomycetota bacterium]